MADRRKQLFGEALDLAPAERDSFLAAACGDDATLRRDLERLLGAHDAAGDFLVHPAALAAAAAAAAEWELDDDGLIVGQRIGNHRLLERIGRGGFGSVWRARQHAPVERDVALKVLRAGVDGTRIDAAFAVELQALARMQHPGIAKVFDAGRTDDDRPWLAMELVTGERVSDWCRRTGADLDARLRLFVAVCAAVQHAHTKGIVHRDLKPANVLVTQRDGVAAPVVIDFGVARAFDTASRADATPDEAPFGTPEYMSPEQIVGGPQAVDARSDIWSLGVMLYELVTDHRPHRRSEAGQEDLLRRIREVDPAPASAAAARRLPRELDWITARAMARDPAARYLTTAALADDVQRLLDGHAVLAGPDHMRYRLGRFVRRHALAVGAALAVVLSLGVGTTVATRGWLQASAAERTARHEQQLAVREAERARRVLTVLDGLWSDVDPSRFTGENYPVRELLADFERTLPRRLADEPAVELHLRRTLGRLHRFVGALAPAETHASRAVELAEALEDRAASATALLLRAQVRYDSGRQDAALDDALAAQLLLTQIDDQGEPFANALEIEASCRSRRGEQLLALQQAQRALALREAAGDAEAIARSQMQLANLHGQVGRIDEAMQHVRSALDTFEALGPDHPDTLVALQHLGFLQQRNGDHAAAEQSLRETLVRRRRVYGERHAQVAWAEADLGWLLHERNRSAEAALLLRDALPLLRELLGEQHLYVTETMQRLGAVSAALGEHDEAARLLDEAVRRFRELPGHPREGLIASLGNLGKLRWALGEQEQAIELLENALAQADAVLPEDHYLRSIGRTNLAWMLVERGETTRAITLLREAVRGSTAGGRDGERHLQQQRLDALLEQVR